MLIASMTTARVAQTAKDLLSDGTVLIAGGSLSLVTLATAELFDPSTGSFTPTGSMTTAREGQTATLLSNGTVLIAGGLGEGGGQALVTAELFNPSTGNFTPTGSLLGAGRSHTATELKDGTVLLTGGEDLVYEARGCPPQPHASASAELYDPTTGTFAYTSKMAVPRALHTATLLANGKVLVTGGEYWTYVTPRSGCSARTTIVTASAELL